MYIGFEFALESLFNLDPRNADECRATQHAYGMVFYLAAEYEFLGSARNYSTTLSIPQALTVAPRPAGTCVHIERASWV